MYYTVQRKAQLNAINAIRSTKGKTESFGKEERRGRMFRIILFRSGWSQNTQWKIAWSGCFCCHSSCFRFLWGIERIGGRVWPEKKIPVKVRLSWTDPCKYTHTHTHTCIHRGERSPFFPSINLGVRAFKRCRSHLFVEMAFNEIARVWREGTQEWKNNTHTNNSVWQRGEQAQCHGD